MDVGDIADVNHGAIDHFYGEIVEFRGLHRAAVQSDVVFAGPKFDGALRKNQILRAYGVDHFGPGDAPRSHCPRVKIDADLPRPASIGSGDGRALDVGKLNAKEIHTQVEELALGKSGLLNPN